MRFRLSNLLLLVRLMLDANQAWDVDSAMEVLAGIEDLAPDWMEEPLAADAPRSQWRAVGDATNIPIAGGENVRGADEFREIIDEAVFDVIEQTPPRHTRSTSGMPAARPTRHFATFEIAG